MMYMVQVPRGVPPKQVDDFPEGCARSRKGGVHFRTNSTIRITEDEYNHVLNSPNHGDFGRRLLVVHKGESNLEKAKAKEGTPEAKAEKKEAKADVDDSTGDSSVESFFSDKKSKKTKAAS